MNRADLKAISAMRIREAKVLLDAGQFSGSYYLAGYSIECALKACVARQVRSGDFPDKKLANLAFTHDLDQLVGLAGLKRSFETDRNANDRLDVNWAIVKDWNEEARYRLSIRSNLARDMYSACRGRNSVLAWVRKRW
jgi:HEPN domain-containing protein